MKHTLPALALALALPGCSMLPAPETASSRTTLDERGALGAEQSYQALARLILARNKLSPYSPAQLERIKALDARAYSAVQAVRAAYRAGNATNYLSAIADAKTAIANLLEAIK